MFFTCAVCGNELELEERNVAEAGHPELEEEMQALLIAEKTKRRAEHRARIQHLRDLGHIFTEGAEPLSPYEELRGDDDKIDLDTPLHPGSCADGASCKACWKALNADKIPPNALVMHNWAGHVPPELKDLTRVEVSMLALINSITMVTMRPPADTNGQRSYWASKKGYNKVFSIVNDAARIATQLPRMPTPESLAVFINKNQAVPKKLTFRPEKVRGAIAWLLKNNLQYIEWSMHAGHTVDEDHICDGGNAPANAGDATTMEPSRCRVELDDAETADLAAALEEIAEGAERALEDDPNRGRLPEPEDEEEDGGEENVLLQARPQKGSLMMCPRSIQIRVVNIESVKLYPRGTSLTYVGRWTRRRTTISI